jgi:hypothetical protein
MGGRSSDAGDEGFQSSEGVWFNAIADARSVDLAADKAGVLQDLEVLRHGGLRERQLVHDVAADTGVPTNQEAEDLDPGRVTGRLAEERKLLVGVRALDGTEVGLLQGAGRGWTDCHGARRHIVILR